MCILKHSNNVLVSFFLLVAWSSAIVVVHRAPSIIGQHLVADSWSSHAVSLSLHFCCGKCMDLSRWNLESPWTEQGWLARRFVNIGTRSLLGWGWRCIWKSRYSGLNLAHQENVWLSLNDVFLAVWAVGLVVFCSQHGGLEHFVSGNVCIVAAIYAVEGVWIQSPCMGAACIYIYICK